MLRTQPPEFKRSSHGTIVNRLEGDEALFNNLFRFIRKNKEIPKLLSKITPDDKNAHELLTAIQHGDFDAKIFNDSLCYIYLLYLMKEGKINFWHGITVYVYLIALMQFTQKQPLKKEDKDVKLERKISVYSLVKEGKLTEQGKTFLQTIHKQLKESDYKLEYAELETFVLNLPPIEQCVIRIPYLYDDKIDRIYNINIELMNHSDRLTSFLLENIPFIMEENLIYRDRTYCVPSSSIINYILSKTSTEPVKMLPVFGSVGKPTLCKLHSENIHPVSLYAYHVKSNPNDADSYRCGPFVMWLHDICHTFWGSMLTPEERKAIFKTFIPQMEYFLKQAAEYKDEPLIKKIQQTIDRAYDFDLSRMHNSSGRAKLFHRYLRKTLGSSEDDKALLYLPLEAYSKGIGIPAEDRLYLMLWKLYYELQPGYEKDFWTLIICSIKTGVAYRHDIDIEALKALAKYAANKSEVKLHTDYHQNLKRLNWEGWLKIVNKSNNSSEKLWKLIIKDDFKHDLTQLTRNGVLMFLHPYIPLTAEKIMTFKKFLEENKGCRPDEIQSTNNNSQTFRLCCFR